MRRIFFISSICAASILTAVGKASASEVEAELARLGPKAFLEKLSPNSDKWDAAIAAIESGDSEWVRAALKLYPVADGGAGTELHDALFASLRTQAVLVLSNLPSGLTVENVCGGRHDPLATLDLALSEEKEVEGAISALKGKIAESQRSQCLSALQSGKRELHRFFEQ